MNVLDKNHLEIKVWERGSGATLACGTGACACLVASSMLKLSSSDVEVKLPGGTLNVKWIDHDQTVTMIGPAIKVFEGLVSYK